MGIYYGFVDRGRKSELKKFETFIEDLRNTCLKALHDFGGSNPSLKEEVADAAFAVGRCGGFRPLACMQERHIIGTISRSGFRWRTDNGFSNVESVENFLAENPGYFIEDEYGDELSAADFLLLL